MLHPSFICQTIVFIDLRILLGRNEDSGTSKCAALPRVFANRSEWLSRAGRTMHWNDAWGGPAPSMAVVGGVVNPGKALPHKIGGLTRAGAHYHYGGLTWEPLLLRGVNPGQCDRGRGSARRRADSHYGHHSK